MVFAYWKDGVLRVSVDVDEVDPGLTHGEEQRVPLCISVGGSVVFAVDGNGFNQGNRRPKDWTEH